MTSHQEIESILKKLPHRMQVLFAVYCCDDVIDLIKDKVAIKALDLTKQWLKDPASVTGQELNDAAYAAHVAAAVYVAAHAADYAAAAYAAHAAASNTTYAAAYAAADAYAAYAAAYVAANASKDKEKKLSQYLKHLKSMIKDLSKLEKAIYGIL